MSFTIVSDTTITTTVSLAPGSYGVVVTTPGGTTVPPGSLTVLSSTPAGPGACPILGTAATFAVLGGTPVVSNTGATVVSGNLGIWPASSVTGFTGPPMGTVINGTIQAGTTPAMMAQAAATTAVGALNSMACTGGVLPATITTVLTLTPGVYCATSSVTFAVGSGLVLDAQGSTGAFFVFIVPAALTVQTGVKMSAINDPTGGIASGCNVFWTVGTQATINATATFLGTVIAGTTIAVGSGATVFGRLLAQTAEVTLIDDVVTAPSCTCVLALS